MEKRITILLMFAFALLGCKEEKKADNTAVEKTAAETNVDQNEYETLESSFDEMQVIFDDGYTFSEGITIDEIGLLKTGENTYQIAYFFDKDSDFNKIEALKIAFRVYPEDPSLFQNEADRKAKAKTIASDSEIKLMDSIKTIMSEEFSLVPKDFKQVKVYFYTPEDGVLGTMMTILDLQFP